MFTKKITNRNSKKQIKRDLKFLKLIKATVRAGDETEVISLIHDWKFDLLEQQQLRADEAAKPKPQKAIITFSDGIKEDEALTVTTKFKPPVSDETNSPSVYAALSAVRHITSLSES